MPLLEEISGTTPLHFPIQMVRGDSFVFKFAEFRDEDPTDVDALIPANLSGSTFRLHVKPHADSQTIFLNAEPDDFLLGQSQVALDYDVAEGNAAGTTFDELHLIIPPARTEIRSGCWVYDLEWTDPGGDVTTLFYGEFYVWADRTAMEAAQ
jgi:hypothetical protein